MSRFKDIKDHIKAVHTLIGGVCREHRIFYLP